MVAILAKIEFTAVLRLNRFFKMLWYHTMRLGDNKCEYKYKIWNLILFTLIDIMICQTDSVQEE